MIQGVQGIYLQGVKVQKQKFINGWYQTDTAKNQYVNVILANSAM